MPLSRDSLADALPWAAYVCTETGAEVAREALDRAGVGDSGLRGGGLSGAARLSTGTPIARTLLAEIGNTPLDSACESIAEIRETGAEVIVLGHQGDIATYRALRNAGALDYFCFPVTAEEVLAARTKVPANDPGAAPAPQTRVIGVAGATGGVGASMLARSLAAHAAGRRAGDLATALIDGDLRFGSQAIDMDCAETPGLIEALSAPERVDETFLLATMTELGAGFSLFSHLAGAGQDASTLEAALPRLVPGLRASFDAVILDLPRAAVLSDPRQVEALDALVLVLPGGYAGVNAASRLMARIKAHSPGLRLLPVLSDLRRDAGLTARDIARGIETPLAVTLPRADAAIRKAHRKAMPVVQTDPRGAYARAVRTLWEAAVRSETPAPKARRGLFRRTAA